MDNEIRQINKWILAVEDGDIDLETLRIKMIRMMENLQV